MAELKNYLGEKEIISSEPVLDVEKNNKERGVNSWLDKFSTKMRKLLAPLLLAGAGALASGCSGGENAKYNTDSIGVMQQALISNARSLGVKCGAPVIDLNDKTIRCGSTIKTDTIDELKFSGPDLTTASFTKSVMNLPQGLGGGGVNFVMKIKGRTFAIDDSGGLMELVNNGTQWADQYARHLGSGDYGPDIAHVSGSTLMVSSPGHPGNPGHIDFFDTNNLPPTIPPGQWDENTNNWKPVDTDNGPSQITSPESFFEFHPGTGEGWVTSNFNGSNFYMRRNSQNNWTMLPNIHGLPSNALGGISIAGCDSNSPKDKYIAFATYTGSGSSRTLDDLKVAKLPCPTTPGEVTPEPTSEKTAEIIVDQDGGTTDTAQESQVEPTQEKTAEIIVDQDGGTTDTAPEKTAETIVDQDGGSKEVVIPEEKINSDTNKPDEVDKTLKGEFTCGDGSAGKIRPIPNELAPNAECKGTTILISGAGTYEYTNAGNTWSKIGQKEVNGCAKTVILTGGNLGLACGEKTMDTRGQKLNTFIGNYRDGQVYGLILGYEGTSAKISVSSPLEEGGNFIDSNTTVNAEITSDKDPDGKQTAIQGYFRTVNEEGKDIQIDLGKLSRGCEQFVKKPCVPFFQANFKELQEQANELANVKFSERPLPDVNTTKPGCNTGCSTNPNNEKTPSWPAILGLGVLAALRRRKALKEESENASEEK